MVSFFSCLDAGTVTVVDVFVLGVTFCFFELHAVPERISDARIKDKAVFFMSYLLSVSVDTIVVSFSHDLSFCSVI